MGDSKQIKTPEWVLPDIDARTALASENAAQYPVFIRDLAAGRSAQTVTASFFQDHRGGLWLSGHAQILPPDDGDSGFVRSYIAKVERVEHGVRVVDWPAGRNVVHHARFPNMDGEVEDMWVVGFPASGS